MAGASRDFLTSAVRALALTLLGFVAATLTLPVASAATGDVKVAIEATPDPVKPGQHVLFTVTFANGTAAPVANWNVSATVPQLQLLHARVSSMLLQNTVLLANAPSAGHSSSPC